MSAAEGVKRAAFRALKVPWINRRLVQPLRRVPFTHRLPRFARLPVAGEFEIRGFDVRIVLRSDGRDSIASSLFWHGAEGFERETTLPFRNLARSSRTVLDIGANSGVYSLLAASANLAVTVFAFEPMPVVAECLRGNVAANQLANVHVSQVAVGASPGVADFFVPSANTLPVSSSLAAGFRVAESTLRVPVVTLDAFADENDLRSVDILKIDTETTEPDVLIGASAMIGRHRPVIFCEVLRGRTEAALSQIFEDLRYESFRLAPEGLVRCEDLAAAGGAERNFLFVPTERIPWVEQHVGVPILG